jgi:mono/diheme cytochrome c family protein
MWLVRRLLIDLSIDDNDRAACAGSRVGRSRLASQCLQDMGTNPRARALTGEHRLPVRSQVAVMKQIRFASISAIALAAAMLAACDNNADENGAPAAEDPSAAINQPAPAPEPNPAPAPAPNPDPAVPAPDPGPAAAPSAGAADPAAGAGVAAAAAGEQAYAAAGCAGCHGQEGGGGVGPALAGNANLNNATLVVTQILQGGETMPPFADRLSDEEVAAVANYIRTAWGNMAAEMIAPADVAAMRGAGP